MPGRQPGRLEAAKQPGRLEAAKQEVAIVIGVGPEDGLGGALCKRFAERGMHVFAAGRTRAKLDALVAVIQAGGRNATAQVADATSEADAVALFDAARAAGDLRLAIYNAGNNFPGAIKDMDAAYFEQCWRVCCFGGFLFGREAVRRMSGGSVLFTGASASLRGRANFGAFNAAKGALRNYAQALAKEVGSAGIHVGHVVVDGPIGGEKIKKGLPEYAEKLGETRMIGLDGIADAYEYLHGQPPTAWSFEVDLRTSVERW
jgi:NAD(P)-dependent dehydrogenase (short-subunit alcohol dehydrogenase family)